MIVLVQDSAQIALEIQNPMRGQWTVQYNANGNCLLFAFGQTNLTVSAGFLIGGQSIHLDNPMPYILIDAPSYYVAHANGLAYPGSIQLLEIFENSQLIWSSEARTRLNCAYETFFGTIVCNSLSSYYYKVLYVRMCISTVPDCSD